MFSEAPSATFRFRTVWPRTCRWPSVPALN